MDLHDLFSLRTLGGRRRGLCAVLPRAVPGALLNALLAALLGVLLPATAANAQKPASDAQQPVSASSVNEMRLHMAAAADDAATIQQLLALGTAVDARDANGRTPLLVATHGNRVRAAQALIKAGADVNAKDSIEDSPYLYAGARGHLEILKLTLAHGADLKSVNRYGGTALIPAAERGHVETVCMLIAAGVNVDHVNRLGWTALLEAIMLGNGGRRHQQIVDLLLTAKADPNLADRDGVTPLQHARSRGYREIEQRLLKAGAR